MSDCIYAMKRKNEPEQCSLKLCEGRNLEECCDSCSEYAGPNRGLGDVVKNVAEAVGIKPCGGCQKRREAMNRWSKKRAEKKKQSEDSA